MHSTEIDKIINEISKLPGLGRRSAQRIALYLLKNKERALLPLLQSLQEANKQIIDCKICGNIDTKSPCSLCQNIKRDLKTICIVEDVSDLWTFERIGFYRGMYHVLGGTLSAINGIGVDELSIKQLTQRIEKNNVKEIILALSSSVNGQTTAHFIKEQLKGSNVQVTKLAQGLPFAAELDYCDSGTLTSAIKSRTPA